MKEFATKIERELEAGLRSDSRAKVNHIQLVQCKNLKPVKGVGLCPYEPASNPFSGLSYSHPFPQLFKGRNVTLLAFATAVYTVNESTWAKTLITTYDVFDEASTKSITTGGAWHFVDLGDVWFLFNGVCVVFKTNRRGMFGYSEKVFVQTVQTIQTGCTHRGRVITGGFSSDFWQGDWKQWMDEWLADGGSGVEKANLGSNFVMWSGIGGGDLLFWLLPRIAIYGVLEDPNYHSNTKALIFDMLKRNDLGWMPMEWEGTVQRVAPLGKNVIVYGDNGVTALVPVVEPVSTFGKVEIATFGVYGRACVGVGKDRHIFLDKAGRVWQITADLQLTQLGYEEFLYSTLATAIISYNPILEEFVIGHSAGSYVLTDAGLGFATQKVTSIAVIDGAVKGVAPDVSDVEALIETDRFDLGVRGIKQLSTINIGGTSLTSSVMSVAAKYRFNKGSALSTTPYMITNNEGNARLEPSGIDFALLVKNTNYVYADIGYIEVRYRVTDRRYIRGIYASQNTE